MSGNVRLGAVSTLRSLIARPEISDFSPRIAYPGTVLEITGKHFSPLRTANVVTVGGFPARVLQASETQLKVLTDLATKPGPVRVRVGAASAISHVPFVALRQPPHFDWDGPPVVCSGGSGGGLDLALAPTGTANALIVLVNPTDLVPSDPTAARDAIVAAWNNVHTYYDQASFGRLNVVPTVTASWHTLSGTWDDYTELHEPRGTALPRLMAETAQAAADEGLSVNDFQVMGCIMYMDGRDFRGAGGWSWHTFQYTGGPGPMVDITTDHDIWQLFLNEAGEWGRHAHELGHCLVSVPPGVAMSPGAATLGEDLYASDLYDSGIATAEEFDLMGQHDSHPLFSAYNMQLLTYFESANILDLVWDGSAFSGEYELVAHGLTENTDTARYHLIRLRIAEGLYYYVEVRQQPGTTAQIFDSLIPIADTSHTGGVVVTKVLTDADVINQQLRFITLLHDPHVLLAGEVATDPARNLRITVLDDAVVARPLVCRVRIEWGVAPADDPMGLFDLRIEPWDSSWQSPDIWVDRPPYGVYDQPLDPEGRPLGNGDRPWPTYINYFYGRIHCDGAVAATNVRVTFYVVDPPGVGDNGNWAPIQTVVVPTIAAGGYQDVYVDWVPVVGEHTCLRVYAEHQDGEISAGNNWAQENVFDFEAASSSVPDPLLISLAVRNPLKEPALIYLDVKGVPAGYTVQLPHAWLQMKALEERRLELAVLPEWDYTAYQRRQIPLAELRVVGWYLRRYTKPLADGSIPPARAFGIGGMTARVAPKKRVRVTLRPAKGQGAPGRLAFSGALTPGLATQALLVELVDPLGQMRLVPATTDERGRFGAVFDLAAPPIRTPGARGGPPDEAKGQVVPGVYTARARIVNARDAAETVSPPVHVRVRG